MMQTPRRWPWRTADLGPGETSPGGPVRLRSLFALPARLHARPLGSAAAPVAGWTIADLAIASLFLLLFWSSAATLVSDWWIDPESDRGLLLGPLAVYLAYKTGLSPSRTAQPKLGAVLLAAFILLRYAAEVTVDRYTLRFAMLGAAVALVVFYFGYRQVLRWWLPFFLFWLIIPLPNGVWTAIALPLQLWSAEIGASLLAWRGLPVQLADTVIYLPGHALLVTEGCSGLRSMTTMLALALLSSEIWLRSPWSRAMLVLGTLPIALLLNGVRIFFTGFLVFFVGQMYGEGTYHEMLGWVIFVINASFLVVGVWTLAQMERWSSALGGAR